VEYFEGEQYFNVSQGNTRILGSARSVEDETQHAELNGNQNPECWGDFSQLQIQFKQKSQFEFVPQDISEFKFDQNLNYALYREIQTNLIS